jgi:hypothetical protein
MGESTGDSPFHVRHVKSERTLVTALVVAALLIVLGAGAVIYTGVYNVAATAPHWRMTAWLVENGRIRSVKAQAAGIAVPFGLDDPAKILMASRITPRIARSATARPACPKVTSGAAFTRRPRPGQNRAALQPRRAVLDRQAGIKMTGCRPGAITATRSYGRRSPSSKSCQA